jgi:hypothetical protein
MTMDVLRSIVVFSISDPIDQMRAHLELDKIKIDFVSSLVKDFELCDVCFRIQYLNSEIRIDESLFRKEFGLFLMKFVSANAYKSFTSNFNNVTCKCISSRFVFSEVSKTQFFKVFPESISSINMLCEITQKCKKDPSLLRHFSEVDELNEFELNLPKYSSTFNNSFHTVSVVVNFGMKRHFGGEGIDPSKKKAKDLAAKACLLDMMRSFKC